MRRIAASLLFIITLTGCTERRPKAVAVPPTVVMASKPVVSKVTDYQIFTARTQAVESVDVKARVTGYLKKITFDDGAVVKKDQVLFEIDDRPYKAALDQAKASLEFANASLVKAQADYDIGLAVQKQSPGAISQQDLAKRLGNRDEAKASIDQAKASLETAELNYGWCKVTSPISGLANSHFVDVGNIVSKDVTTLTNVVSQKPIWANFYVDENTSLLYQKLVAEGKAKGPRDTEFPVQMALENSQGFPFAGKVDFISNQLDPTTGSIRVRAVFPNDVKDTMIGIGMFGRIKVPMGEAHTALLVNDRAIGSDQAQSFILVLSDKNEVEYRIVEVGQVQDGLREVLAYRTITETDAKGKETTKKVEVLKATDSIIVDGLQRVRPGMTVDPRLVDMRTLLPVKK